MILYLKKGFTTLIKKQLLFNAIIYYIQSYENKRIRKQLN